MTSFTRLIGSTLLDLLSIVTTLFFAALIHWITNIPITMESSIIILLFACTIRICEVVRSTKDHTRS